MVSALACRIRGREFESHVNHFPQNQIIIFLFPCLSFFLNFEVKQCANIYLKYDNTGFVMEKKPNFFIFQNGKYPTQGQNKTHCLVIKLSIQSTILLSRWRWPCIPDDEYYIRGKRNALWFWQHFGRTITLAGFDIPIVSTESQVLYSFIIKVRMDTPIFYFLIFFWQHCTLILHT